jgi:hypothetical protein
MRHRLGRATIPPLRRSKNHRASGRDDKMLTGLTRDGGVKPPLRSSAVGPRVISEVASRRELRLRVHRR